MMGEGAAKDGREARNCTRKTLRTTCLQLKNLKHVILVRFLGVFLLKIRWRTGLYDVFSELQVSPTALQIFFLFLSDTSCFRGLWNRFCLHTHFSDAGAWAGTAQPPDSRIWESSEIGDVSEKERAEMCVRAPWKHSQRGLKLKIASLSLTIWF